MLKTMYARLVAITLTAVLVGSCIFATPVTAYGNVVPWNAIPEEWLPFFNLPDDILAAMDMAMNPENSAVPFHAPIPQPQPAPANVHPSQLPRWYPEAIEWVLTDENIYLVRQEFYRLVNEHRAAHGLRPLEVNLALQDYADIRAAELAVKFSHTRPDGSDFGSGWHSSLVYVENASSVGTVNPDPLLQALNRFNRWRNSDAHNRNMLTDFAPHVAMAFGMVPTLVPCSVEGEYRVTSGTIFIAGYGDGINIR